MHWSARLLDLSFVYSFVCVLFVLSSVRTSFPILICSFVLLSSVRLLLIGPSVSVLFHNLVFSFVRWTILFLVRLFFNPFVRCRICCSVWIYIAIPNLPYIPPEVDTWLMGILPTLWRVQLPRWDFPADSGLSEDGTLGYSLFWSADCTFNYIAVGLCWREARSVTDDLWRWWRFVCFAVQISNET